MDVQPVLPSEPLQKSPLGITPARVHQRFGEARGERKRARQERGIARRNAQAVLDGKLVLPHENSSAVAQRWDAFYQSKHTLFKYRHLLRALCPELVSESVLQISRQHIPPLACVHLEEQHREMEMDVDKCIKESGCDQILLECGAVQETLCILYSEQTRDCMHWHSTSARKLSRLFGRAMSTAL